MRSATKGCLAIKRKVAVVGSAGGALSPQALGVCRELGRQIARRDCIIITGACPGLPHEAVLGARELGGLAIGISPALCLDEHRERYGSPWEEYVLVYTGSGLMGREVEVIRSGDMVVVVGGRSGTLGEFAIAYDDGNVIGVLQGTGGIADALDHIVGFIAKDTGSEMIYASDPCELVDLALAAHDRRVADGVAYSINEAEHEWRDG
jgi:uncharacterized protein (TIGR00725 family)